MNPSTSEFKIVSFVLSMLFALRFDFQRREIIIQKIRDFIKSIFNDPRQISAIKKCKPKFKNMVSAFFGIAP